MIYFFTNLQPRKYRYFNQKLFRLKERSKEEKKIAIWVSVSVSDLNQNRGFGHTLQTVDVQIMFYLYCI